MWEYKLARFTSRVACVRILGLGYAGLPLACCFAEAGFKTRAFDIDAAKVHALQSGQSDIKHIPPERIAKLALIRK
jgi:UDP-N-acetyl-D-glucosamine dehydrogenase